MRKFHLLTAVLLFANLAIAAGKTPDPKMLLEKSDRARGGLSQGMKWSISLESRAADAAQIETKFDIKIKGVNVLARCTAPARQKDEVYLFNDRNLWVFRPGLRKPISVSPRQRLSGQAANGDIANTNYARDYDGKITGEETIAGVPSWKLALKSKSPNTTYDAINYWISKDKNLGMQAEFLTSEGKAFKRATVEYKNSITSGGAKIPFISKMTIVDAAFANNLTTMTYTNPQPEALSDSIFNVNNLAR